MISGRYNGARILNPVSHFKLQHHDGETWQEVLPAVEENGNPAWSATFAAGENKTPPARHHPDPAQHLPRVEGVHMSVAVPTAPTASMTDNTMSTHSTISRRHFLGASVASTSAVMITAGQRSNAAPATAASTEGETDHFWYRLAPADPYIDSQRDNKAFGFRDANDLAV